MVCFACRQGEQSTLQVPYLQGAHVIIHHGTQVTEVVLYLCHKVSLLFARLHTHLASFLRSEPAEATDVDQSSAGSLDIEISLGPRREMHERPARAGSGLCKDAPRAGLAS